MHTNPVVGTVASSAMNPPAHSPGGSHSRRRGNHGRSKGGLVAGDPYSGLAQLGVRRRRHRRVRRLLFAASTLVLVCLIVVGAGFAYIQYRNSQIKRVTVHGVIAPVAGQPENILLVGSNSRCALNGQQASSFGSCSQVGGARSDVTMLLHLDPRTKTASILSIPRDLFLPIPGTNNMTRVDAALNQGPDELVKTIEDDLGIPINHFVELNFDTFQNVVQDLGGINMYFPDPVKDNYSQLNITTAGCHHLNGFEALAVVRARHLFYYANSQWNYDGMGDLSRIKRDHEFLRVLASEVQSRGLSNLATINSILGTVAPQLQVDSGFSLGEMVDLVRTFRHVNAQNVPSQTLPVVIDNSTYYYKGFNDGLVVLPSEPQDQQAINQFLGTSASAASQGVVPASVRVQVLNGTGAPNQAADTSAALQSLGFDVTGIGDTQAGGSVVETVVYYAPGNQAQAELVASDLTGVVVVGQGPVASGDQVTVVTGSNFAVASPSSTGTTAPATSTSSSQLPPPTAASTQLPAWDPRSCGPNGTAGP